MKTKKQFYFVAMVAIIGIACAIIACDNGNGKNDNPPEITREFNDLTFLGKTVTLIDRTGNASDLKTRGIWQKIKNGLEAIDITGSVWISKFNTVYANNDFVIVVNSGADYTYGYGVDGYEILFRETQLAGFDAEIIASIIAPAIEFNVPGHINE